MHLNCETMPGNAPKVPGRACTVIPASGSRSSIGNHGQLSIGGAPPPASADPRLKSKLGPARVAAPPTAISTGMCPNPDTAIAPNGHGKSLDPHWSPLAIDHRMYQIGDLPGRN